MARGQNFAANQAGIAFGQSFLPRIERTFTGSKDPIAREFLFQFRRASTVQSTSASVAQGRDAFLRQAASLFSGRTPTRRELFDLVNLPGTGKLTGATLGFSPAGRVRSALSGVTRPGGEEQFEDLNIPGQARARGQVRARARGPLSGARTRTRLPQLETERGPQADTGEEARESGGTVLG